MKKLLALILALAMFTAFVGCGAKEEEKEEESKAPVEEKEESKEPVEEDDGFVVAGIYKMGDATWFMEEGKASQAVIEAAGGTWKYMDAKQDGATYMEMIDNCIADKVDGVLVCLPDQNLSQATVDKLEEAGIPVIAVDDALQTEDGTKIAPWVGIDAYKIGLDVGNWAVNYITENNLVENEEFGVMLLTADTVSSCVPRTDGQMDAIAEAFPELVDEGRIYRADHDTSTEQGNTAASTVITGHPEITQWLILGVSDEGAQGASRAIEANGLEEGSMVVGLGGYLAPAEFANEESPFKAAAYFSAKGVGGMAAEAMVAFLKDGTEIPAEAAVSAVIVEPDDDLASIMPEYVG